MGQEALIAKRYAAALAEYAADGTDGARDPARLRADIRLLAGIVDPRGEAHVPEMTEFLSSPGATPAEKSAAAAAVLDRLGVGAAARRFFLLLAERGRTGLLPRIAACFEETAGALSGERSGVVETARPLAADQLERLSGALSAAFGGTVLLEQRVNPDLLAGAKVVLGGTTIDNTVLGKWRRIRDGLASGVPLDAPLVCALDFGKE